MHYLDLFIAIFISILEVFVVNGGVDHMSVELGVTPSEGGRP